MNDEDNRTEPAGTADNLRLLDGVGPKFERLLRDIGIHTFADLAAYETPADLHQAFQEKAGEDVGLSRIENKQGTGVSWIEQARERAEQADTTSELHNTGEEVVPSPEPESSKPEAEWQMVQEFTLFLDDRVDREGLRQWQLRAYDGDSGDEEPFAVRDYRNWVQWILDHAQMPDSEKFELPDEAVSEPLSLPEVVTDEEEEALTKPVQVDIIDVEIGRSTATERSELEASLTFKLSSAEGGRLVAGRIPFQVEVHALNLEDGTSQLGGWTRGQLEPGRFEYQSRLTFPMLELGRYELQSIVLLFPPGEVVSFYKGGTFRIVP